MEELIRHSLQASINLLDNLLKEHIPVISQAAHEIVHSLGQGGKILCCGNGGSAADAAHFAAELLNRFETERQPLPAIALNNDSATLTAIANDYDYTQVFSKQILALGCPEDVLLAITTSGNSPNVLQAVRAAKQKHLRIIALTGETGGELVTFLRSTDVVIRVPSKHTARIQEAHAVIIHCLCQIIDHHFAQKVAYEKNCTIPDPTVPCQ